MLRGCDERRLLGLAFHPDFEENGRRYTFTSGPVARKPDFSTLPAGVAPNCQSVITEWRVVDPGADTLNLDAASARGILRIDKPQFNHDVGTLMFGHDELLFVGIGDGGEAYAVGVGHAPGGNGQSLAPGNVLGKSFDRRTRHLWASDVGQNDIEEVDVVKAGQNHGWPIAAGAVLRIANPARP